MNNIYKNLDLQDLDGETWKVIEEYPDYMISNLSRIKSFKNNNKIKLLKQIKHNKYLAVHLYKNGKCKIKKVHILLYETFKEKLKSNECIHHINENKLDNILENFEKMTKFGHKSFHIKGDKNPNFNKKLSKEHKSKIGEKNKGEFCHSHKLTEIKVIQIKMLLKLGFKNVEISKLYGVNKRTISSIKLGITWSHIKV